MKFNQEKTIELRKELHKSPELSGQEKNTALQIKEFISPYKPDEVIENIGGYGIAFIFKGQQNGPTVMFRCELDALPIDEVNNFNHRSSTYGISHKCGHDGHMAILSGLAEVISKNPLHKGRVVLLFQPAEETGQGARKVLEDPKFELIKPDFVFALHNIPGFPINSIIIKDEVFSSASIGLIIRIKGKTSHASEPEKGQNPAFAMANILKRIENYALPGKNFEKVEIITPIYGRLGEQAFGTSPGYGELMFTLRATQTKDIEKLKEFLIATVENSINSASPFDKLSMEYEWVEEFPNTRNDFTCMNMISQAAEKSGFSIENLNYPFRWSEDFGHFLRKYPGALFGLGAGTNQPALHNPDYDFPDELIATGVQMFHNIYTYILK